MRIADGVRESYGTCPQERDNLEVSLFAHTLSHRGLDPNHSASFGGYGPEPVYIKGGVCFLAEFIKPKHDTYCNCEVQALYKLGKVLRSK